MGELKVVVDEKPALPVYEKTYSGKHQLKLLEDVFNCVDQPPTGWMVQNMNDAQDVNMRFLREFFGKVIHPDELDRLWYVLDFCGMEALQEQMQYLWEGYSGRPTVGVSSSRGGSKKSRGR